MGFYVLALELVDCGGQSQNAIWNEFQLKHNECGLDTVQFGCGPERSLTEKADRTKVIE